jgi:hypothetical protein
MREHRAPSGRLIYYATRDELERLPGYRGRGDRARACCPIHNGDNPDALSIDWATGWATCWRCGKDAFSIRVEDHPDAHAPHLTGGYAPERPRIAPRRDERRRSEPSPALPAPDIAAALKQAIATAADRLPLSPGITYLAGRGIPLDVAQSLRLGWSPAGKLAGRVIFPLTDPDGRATSAIGRLPYDPKTKRERKYDTLEKEQGYVKTLFNGAAIAQARRSGHPLVIVEGPMDVAACVAAGIPLAVAICGKSYAHPEYFAGIQTVILALDADEAGQQGRRALWLDLTARGVEVEVLPTAALAGCKDLAEFWQRYRTMPAWLAARVIGPHCLQAADIRTPRQTSKTADISGHSTPATVSGEDPASDEYGRDRLITPDELPDALKAEAEALALELAHDTRAWLQFCYDLERNGSTLTAADRGAADYALLLAEQITAAIP